MPNWLRIAIVILAVWVGLGLLMAVLRIAAALAGLLALPIAALVGYAVWKKGGLS